MHTYIKCPDGFANQLRLSLAANYLMSIGEIKTATQEWIVNNHNIVKYDKFFKPLRHLHFDKIEKDKNPITTTSFTNLVNKYGDPQKILIKSFSYLSLLSIPSIIIHRFIRDNDIMNCIGLHVRTGCKNALLAQDKNRSQPISHQSIINMLKTEKRKIFLATDNAETQNKFLDIFQDQIIVFEKINYGKENFIGKYDRNKVERFSTDIHVVADFFILKNCYKFIGSNESSFSIMINWLRDNKNDLPLKGIL